MNLKKLLQQLGLNNKEANVYLTSLSLGTKPASIIAKLAQLPRSSTRVILMQLHKKGFINYFTKNNVQYFWPTPPQDLIKLLNKQQDDLELLKEKVMDALPILENIYKTESHIPRVYYFEGKKGIIKGYNLLLNQKAKEIYSYDIYGKNKTTVLDDYWPKFYEQRKKSNVLIKSLMTFSDDNLQVKKEDSLYNRQTRFLPFYLISHYGEKVIVNNMIIHYSLDPNELICTVIESKFLAEIEKTIFRTLWFMAGKLEYNPD